MTSTTNKFIGFALPRGFAGSDPSRLYVSTCLAINATNADLTSENNFNAFYEEFLKVQEKFSPQNIEILVDGSGVSATYHEFMFSEAPSGDTDPGGHFKLLRKDLWDNIFPKVKGSTAVQYRTPNLVEITPDLAKEQLPEIRKVVNSRAGLDLNDKDNGPASDVQQVLGNLRKYARDQRQIATQEKLQFVKRFWKEMVKANPDTYNLAANETLAEFVAKRGFDKVHKDICKVYANKEIDVDDFLHRFNALANDSHLARVMGFIYDFEITLPQDLVPIAGKGTEFTLGFQCGFGAEILVNPVKINGIRHDTKDKYAYLVTDLEVPGEPQFFRNSIMDAVLAGEPISYDPVAIEMEGSVVADSAEPADQGGNNSDRLTRGILFTHPLLAKMIQPLAFPTANDPLTAEYVTHGHRVAVVVGDVNPNSFFSLTARSFELRDRTGSSLLDRGHTEGCIHFDAPMTMTDDQTGQQKGVTDNIMFEYSGELLSLKSAFSRAQRKKRIEHLREMIENEHDDGMSKAKESFKGILRFSQFPFNEKIDDDDAAAHVCMYGIPSDYVAGKSPKLRYFLKYRFAVIQEYLNFWAMPLKPGVGISERQMTVWDRIQDEEDLCLSKTFTYKPWESTRPAVLFHTRKKAVADTEPITEREQLETIAILTQSRTSSVGASRNRHLLPERITFEQGFFYDLFENLTPRESYDLKRRHNCPFADKKQYEQYKQETKSECYECGESYCGGTQMAKYYENDRIQPRYIPHPAIGGFEVELFWNKEVSGIPISKAKVTLEGASGLAPKSCRLALKGINSGYNLTATEYKKIEISLKKGMIAYAKISNQIVSAFQNGLDSQWWMQGFSSFKRKLVDQPTLAQILDEKTKGKVVTLVHAVKEPLITPRIFAFFSPNPPISYNNLVDWLRRKYSAPLVTGGLLYQPDRNIVAVRPDLPKNEVIRIVLSDGSLVPAATRGTKSRPTLSLSFERLDAMFVEEEQIRTSAETPTGKLELFTRSEEYADDPRQYVFDPAVTRTPVNYVPTEPLSPFSDFEHNRFSIDKEIDFSDEILGQLKSSERLTLKPNAQELFTDVITRLDIDLDLKGFRFEEREYYLRGTSKFKGFFTEDTSDSEKTLEDYVLPKAKDVKEDRRLRFKVMALNSKPPARPEISHVVTTIRELRGKRNGRTISSQKGDTLTVYAHRNRPGKDLRFAIVVKPPEGGIYDKIIDANHLFSRAGRDIVSDTSSPRNKFLRYDPLRPEDSDIVIPPDNPYDAIFDSDLGVMSYLPHFDFEKQLWKFEIQFNIKTTDKRDLHNPFVNLILLNHQPFSLNYNELARKAHNDVMGEDPEWFAEFRNNAETNEKTKERVLSSLLAYSKMENDCRISEPTDALWGYLTAERTVSVKFSEPGGPLEFNNNWGEVDFKVSLDRQSLHGFTGDPSKTKSNLLIGIEGRRNDNQNWYPVMSRTDDGDTKIACEKDWAFLHPLMGSPADGSSSITGIDGSPRGDLLLEKKLRYRKRQNPCDESTQEFKHFRLRVVEVEWFVNKTWQNFADEDPKFLKKDIVDNEAMRVRYIELIY